jgi:hypothetical protein
MSCFYLKANDLIVQLAPLSVIIFGHSKTDYKKQLDSLTKATLRVIKCKNAEQFWEHFEKLIILTD